MLFSDTKLTLINLVGYGIAIAGVAAYNNHKLRKEAQRMSLEVRVDINNVEKSPDQEVQIALLPPKEDK